MHLGETVLRRYENKKLEAKNRVSKRKGVSWENDERRVYWRHGLISENNLLGIYGQSMLMSVTKALPPKTALIVLVISPIKTNA
jgi:hypothetical protein